MKIPTSFRTLSACVAAAAALAAFSGPVTAQPAYPSKPVTIVVNFAAGGALDFVARTVAERMTAEMSQPVIIENRPGATGVIGITHVQKATPDGYTLLMAGGGPLTALPALSGKTLPFDTLRDFAPIAIAAVSPYVVTVNGSSKFQSLKDLVAFAKANPGKLTYGSAGPGGAAHLAAELFSSRAGIKMTHIPYKGMGPAFIDLLGGQIDIVMGDLSTALPHMQTGKLKALAITTQNRSKLVPDLPTVGEAGVANYTFDTWFGLSAPAGTPAEVVSRLNAAVVKAVRNPGVTERFEKQGLEPVGNTSAQMTATLRQELESWKALGKAEGLVLE